MRWINKEEKSNNFVGFEPNRKLKSWGTLDDAAEHYANSRVANLIEHKLLSFSDKLSITNKHKELKDYALKSNGLINKKHNLYNNYVVDPDLYEYFLS